MRREVRIASPAAEKEDTSMKPAAVRVAPTRLLPALDGVRAISSLWLVAFHVLLVCTVFHPFGSANDAAFRASWIFGVGCSAFQVDVMLVLSGFLLGRRQRMLCTAAKGTAQNEAMTLFTPLVEVAGSVWSYAMHRALRLWPMLIMCLALQTLLGDAVTSSAGDWFLNAAQVLGFVTPIDLSHGSISLIATWAVALDFQCGVCLFGALEVARRSGLRTDSARAASNCRVALWVLAAAAVAVKFALYDPQQVSEVQMARLSHFDHACAVSHHTRDWLFRTFGDSPTAAITRMGQRSAAGDHGAHSAAAAAFVSLWTQLYAAPHMRYGAMVAGALLAFHLPAESDPSQPTGRRARSFFSHSSPLLGMQAGCEAAMRWGLLLFAVTPFVMGMSTDLEGAGAKWSLEITVLLRGWAAVGTCVLLFCAMAPAASVWRVDWLAAALSWRGWKPIADISYGINMVHMRIILELALRFFPPQEGAAPLTPTYVLGLLALSFALATVVATALTPLEQPLRRGLARALLPRQ